MGNNVDGEMRAIAVVADVVDGKRGAVERHGRPEVGGDRPALHAGAAPEHPSPQAMGSRGPAPAGLSDHLPVRGGVNASIPVYSD